MITATRIGSARSARHQVRGGAVAVRGHRRLVDRLELGGGRVQPPLQLAERRRRTAGGARPTGRSARPLRSSDGSTSAIAGQVARCSSSAASGPRRAGWTGQARARPARRGRRTARRSGCAARRRRPAPRGARGRPGGRAARRRRSRRRRGAGRAAAEASHTAAPTQPARAPRTVRVRSKAMAATVTSPAQPGTPLCEGHMTSARADSNRLHARARERGVNPIVYWLTRAVFQPFAHLYWRMSRIGREHIPTSGPGDLRLQPPVVPGPVRDRDDRPPAALLRGQGGALPAPADRLVPELARRLPGQPRRRRRRHARDRAGDPRPRRLRADLPRGHAHPPRRARPPQARRSAAWRWRPARRSCRSP